MLNSAHHRWPEIAYHLHRWGEGWRIESLHWGFDVRGDKQEFSETVDYFDTEPEARAKLAELQGAQP